MDLYETYAFEQSFPGKTVVSGGAFDQEEEIVETEPTKFAYPLSSEVKNAPEVARETPVFGFKKSIKLDKAKMQGTKDEM